jgi:hypothetical protein
LDRLDSRITSWYVHLNRLLFISLRVAASVFFPITDIEQVKRIHVEARENPIVNRLNKTKVEKFPDLREEKETRLRELRKKDQGARDARVSDHLSFLYSSYDRSLRFCDLLNSLRLVPAFCSCRIAASTIFPRLLDHGNMASRSLASSPQLPNTVV